MIIYFDIETVADEEAVSRTDIHKAIDKYGDKLSFMPEFNKIITITVGTVTEIGYAIKNLEGSEKEQIEKFFDAIKGNNICGFNIKGFDIPFIVKRALKYKLDIPAELYFFKVKPRDLEHIIDLQEVYKISAFSNLGSLDIICNFLGITNPKEEGIDGSQVQEFYDNGKIKEIEDYCKRDVRATMEVYKYFRKYNLI